VWTRRQPVYYDDFLASEAARVDYWDYKLETWAIYSRALPNAVHHAIVALEGAGKGRRGRHAECRWPARRGRTSLNMLVELHGTDRLIKCLRCEATSGAGSALRGGVRRRASRSRDCVETSSALNASKCGPGSLVASQRRHLIRRSVPCKLHEHIQ